MTKTTRSLKAALKEFRLLLRDKFIGWTLLRCDLPFTAMTFASEVQGQILKAKKDNPTHTMEQ